MNHATEGKKRPFKQARSMDDVVRHRSIGNARRTTLVSCRFDPSKFSRLRMIVAQAYLALRRYHQSLQPTRIIRTIDGVVNVPTLSRWQTAQLALSSLSRSFVRPVSLTGAFVLGVFSTGAIYQDMHSRAAEAGVFPAQVAGIGTTVVSEERTLTDDDVRMLSDLIATSGERAQFDVRVRDMVKGYPIENMLSSIDKQDRMVAAFLIAIAKKESNWGKRVPVLEGQDCFNYWGYRGIRDRMGTGGHTCFDSQEDAVRTVGKRINTLIHKGQLDTPSKMIIWKCGNSCSGHSPESVRKWIADVDLYFSAINQNQPEDRNEN